MGRSRVLLSWCDGVLCLDAYNDLNPPQGTLDQALKYKKKKKKVLVSVREPSNGIRIPIQSSGLARLRCPPYLNHQWLG